MKLFTLLFAIVISNFYLSVFGQSVFISQYIETNSGTTPKGIEIFNNSGADIVFTAGNNLQVYQGTNGAACTALVGTNTTTGTLRAGEVWVIGTSDLTTFATANGTDLSGTTTFGFVFNGDDALQVYLGGVLQDVFGTCGSDPGSAWSGSGVSTANQNIQSINGTCIGTTSNWIDPSLRFETVSTDPLNNMTGFGNAPSSCVVSCTAPTTQATNFGTSGISFNDGTVSWTRGNGNNVLVVAREGAVPTAGPVSGAAYTANNTYGNGDALGGGFVVYNGNGTSVSLTGLTSGATYYIEIYEFNNTGTCYLAPALSGNFTTLTVSSTSDIISAGGESAVVSSTEITPGPLTSATGIEVWQFTVRDGGASSPDADGLPTILENLTITQGTGNQMDDWDAAIQSADLFVGTTLVGSGIIGVTDLTFTGLNITVPDNGSVTISLRISLNCGVGYNNGNLDGDDFQFRILNSDVTTAATGTSSFTTFTNCFSADGQNVFQVVADRLMFLQQPITTAMNSQMAPAVEVAATDACGNIDVSATGNITITSTGSLTGTSTTVISLTSGIASFSNLVHDVDGVNFTLDATHGTYGTVTSNLFDIPISTTFERGDFAIVAVNTTRNASGSADEVCFITFKTIAPGTTFDIADNGYERENAGQWGNTEGTVRFTRSLSAPSIAAGSVICIEGPDNGIYSGDGLDYFDIYVCGVKDDANWSIQSLVTNYGVQQMDWNSNDQVWIMQGGTWNNGTNNGHDATYTGGNILYGWTAIGWEAAPGYGSTSGSTFIDGMDCYATDVDGIANNSKVKYVGTKTGSKFELLANINDISNWQGYVDNTAYDATPAAYDYLNEPCATTGFIVTASSGAGVWTGAINTDWFYCANWDDFSVPDATVNVTINQNASNNCEVFNGTGECNSIAISSNNNTNRNLEVQATGILNVINDVTISKTAGTGTLAVSTTGSGELNVQNITITGTAASANNAILRNESATAMLNIDGNLTINNGGFLDLDPNGTMNLAGDYNNNHNANGFSEVTSTVILDGTLDQNINTSGFTEIFQNITSIKPSGNILLQDNVTLNATGVFDIDDEYVLLNGNELRLNNPATTAITRTTGSIIDESGAATGNNSGKISWNIGASLGNYTFPFSDAIGGSYIPFGFETTAGNIGIVSLSTYHTPASNLPWPSSPESVTNLTSTTGLAPDNRDATADRFWQIDKTGISGTATLTFSYLASELPISPYNDANTMIAQRYNSTLNQWEDQILPGQTTGAITGGFTVTVPNVSAFSPWALANIASPLPAELVYFEAKPDNNKVLLDWETASEINVAYFVIERSKDGVHFNPILTQNGSGNSSQNIFYNDIDYHPLNGVSYYRLVTYDYDGSFKYSAIKTVNFENNSIAVLYDSENWIVNYKTESKLLKVDIVDALGAIVYSDAHDANENGIRISKSELASGIYFIIIHDGMQSQSIKVFK